MLELDGRTAVVVGDCAEPTPTLCRLLARHHARIAVVSLATADESAVEDLIDELRWLGADAVGVVAPGPAVAASGVIAELGAPHLLFVLSGADVLGSFLPQMSKGAVVTLATSAASAAAVITVTLPPGVRANVVSWTPGRSPADEVAFAALYLASDATANVNATTIEINPAV